MKRAANTSAKGWMKLRLAVTVLLGVAVYAFWSMLKPHLVIERELLQMFRFSGDYLAERIVMPGGLARYVAEFLSQFFISVRLGALVMALLSVLAQWLTWLLLRRMCPKAATGSGLRQQLCYILSVIPALVFMFLLCDMRVQLTLYVAFLMVLPMLVCLPQRQTKSGFWLSVPVLIAGYWLAGPMVVLVALWPLSLLVGGMSWTKPVLSSALLLLLLCACVVVSTRLVAYPLRMVATGLDYVWPNSQTGTDEEMQYDLLMRNAQWNNILQKARRQPPRNAACRHVVQLAAWFKKQISEQQLAESFGNVRESINSSVSAGVISDFCMHLAMLNIAQRAAFELNESAANYNKSARATKRLAETALCTGQYEVAQKYAALLEQTLFYRRWAQELHKLADHPSAIARHPKYGMLQKVYAGMKDQVFI